MSIVKRHLAEHEVRMVLMRRFCIDAGALVLDIATRMFTFPPTKMPTRMPT